MKDRLNELLVLSRHATKYVVGPEGNTSCRYNDGFLIKASGKHLSDVNESDFVLCDMEGNHDGAIKPSMEVDFHAWFYRNHDVNYIMHTHPIETIKILCSDRINEFADMRLFPDQVVFNGECSCVIDYYHPGKELADGIADGVAEHVRRHRIHPRLILLKNHGIITFGKTAKDCIIASDICEKSASIFLGSMFGRTYLSEKEIKKLVNDDNEKYRQTIGDLR